MHDRLDGAMLFRQGDAWVAILPPRYRTGANLALSIKNPHADQLAKELAETTGETITEAVIQAIRERLDRERARRRSLGGQSAARIRRIQERVARLPVRDPRAPEEIIGYDEHGLPE